MYTYMYCTLLQQEVIATLTFPILLTFDVLFAFLGLYTRMRITKRIESELGEFAFYSN